eukprot:jgi/Mesen1/8003/ME000425S07204
MTSASGLKGRDTRILVVELEFGEFYIVASLARLSSTQVISIDPTTGALGYSGRPGIDVFRTEVEALLYVTAGSQHLVKSRVYAQAILGYAPLGSVGLLLVATRLRQSIQYLPGGDTVYTVADSQWIKVPLRNPQPQPKAELKNAADLADILINDVHYFCDTRDISRPFPSPFPVDRPDAEFVWNEWLSAPFRAIGLGQHCVVLLQGMAESRGFLSASGDAIVVTQTARRSRLHPGTRYLARGLNAASSTGNEIECEQLVWPAQEETPGRSHPFSSYLWRRGTVPIWWGAEIKSTVQEAEIYVAERQPEGAARYFQRLVARYGQGEIPPEQLADVPEQDDDDGSSFNGISGGGTGAGGSGSGSG